MIWLTWRQARLEALIGGAVLTLVAVLLLWTGHGMVAAYHHDGVAACAAQPVPADACWPLTGAFTDRFARLGTLASWLNFLPLLLGLLLAAPFVLELEQGTHRLAWTQSVTRGRWLATKLGLLAAAAAAAPLALVALMTWWRGPLDALQGRFDPNAFDFEGAVPVAYTVFALALVLAVGTLLRRTVPAVGITFAAFLGLRLGIEGKLRPHYLAPVTASWDPTQPGPRAALSRLNAGDWVLSNGFVDRARRPLTDGDLTVRSCFNLANGAGGDKGAAATCLHAHGILNAIVYQPAHRFWLFQGIEAAIFLGLTAALLALTVWWILRRVA